MICLVNIQTIADILFWTKIYHQIPRHRCLRKAYKTLCGLMFIFQTMILVFTAHNGRNSWCGPWLKDNLRLMHVILDVQRTWFAQWNGRTAGNCSMSQLIIQMIKLTRKISSDFWFPQQAWPYRIIHTNQVLLTGFRETIFHGHMRLSNETHHHDEKRQQKWHFHDCHTRSKSRSENSPKFQFVAEGSS